MTFNFSTNSPDSAPSLTTAAFKKITKRKIFDTVYEYSTRQPIPASILMSTVAEYLLATDYNYFVQRGRKLNGLPFEKKNPYEVFGEVLGAIIEADGGEPNYEINGDLFFLSSCHYCNFTEDIAKAQLVAYKLIADSILEELKDKSHSRLYAYTDASPSHKIKPILFEDGNAPEDWINPESLYFKAKVDREEKPLFIAYSSNFNMHSNRNKRMNNPTDLKLFKLLQESLTKDDILLSVGAEDEVFYIGLSDLARKTIEVQRRKEQTSSANKGDSKEGLININLDAEDSLENGNQSYGKVSYYLGKPEWYFWEMSKLEPKDVFQINIITPFLISDIKKAFLGWHVEVSPDGKLVIYSRAGNLDKQIVLEWLENNNLVHNGFRSVMGTMRRDISKLDKRFFTEIIQDATKLAISQIYTKHKSYISQVTQDDTEIPGIATEIVLELAESFDADKGTPFLAYVALRLQNRLHDISRKQTGRALTDFAISYNRLVSLEPEAGYDDSLAAEKLGMTVEQFRKRVSDLYERRSIISPSSFSNVIRSDSEGEEQIIDIPTGDEYNVEEALLKLVDVEMLYSAMASVAEKYSISLPEELDEEYLYAAFWEKDKLILEAKICRETLDETIRKGGVPKAYVKHAEEILLGLKATYLRLWEDRGTVEIAHLTGSSLSEVRAGEKRYHKALREAIEVA